MEIVKSRAIKGKYQELDTQKLTGSHYTPTNLADFVADNILKNFKKSKTEVSIFDPAVGDGQLLLSLTQKLLAAGTKKVKVYGYDINTEALDIARLRFASFGKKVELHLEENDFTLKASSSLPLFDQSAIKYDLVIANPPYVRTQSLGAKSTEQLSADFSLEGRIDLYYVFLLGIKKFMHQDSVAGFIVSNRFMTTKSGASVRSAILKDYNLKEIWDFGDTKLFEAAVLPAVLVFSNANAKSEAPLFTSIYSTKTSGNISNQLNVFEGMKSDLSHFAVDGIAFEVKKGVLPTFEDSSDVWRISNSDTEEWLEQVAQHTKCSFGELGKIRVGVKTTADKVFIRKDWESFGKDKPEAKLLYPLITHHIARRYKAEAEKSRKILYPHISKGGKKAAVDIEKYPKALQYLESHRTQLAGREYLIEAGRNWFEIWVPQEPSLWSKNKIVFRDICERPTFWMDDTGGIVNGDCYWISLGDDVDSDLLWVLLAVANSSFIENFYDHKFNNKLYAGRRRFMTQYVEQFPVPKLTAKQTKEIVDLTKKIFEAIPEDVSKLDEKLDKLVWKAFGF